MPTYYLIRHKPSGTLLPARVLATRYNFDRSDDTHEPRLFKSERAAKNCATCWAQGVWNRELCSDQDGWEMPSYDCLAEPVPTAVPGRSRDDLEVLPATLTIGEAPPAG